MKFTENLICIPVKSVFRILLSFFELKFFEEFVVLIHNKF